MQRLSQILYVLGILLLIMAGFMLIPACIDILDQNEDWKVFVLSALTTAFFGGLFFFSCKASGFSMDVRQAFLVTVFAWLGLCFTAAIPFYYADLGLSYAEAFFEATSGLTTTGSTTLTGLDTMPAGILIWRAILQWLGGVGVLVMALSVLPLLKIGGMQLFKTEALEDQKALPKATQMSFNIILIYCFLTLCCFIAYRFVGLGNFDALAHAMTTIATGGYSTKDASIGHFPGYGPAAVATLFMILSALPFLAYLRAVRQHKNAFRDSQILWFLGILGSCILATLFFLGIEFQLPFAKALSLSALNVTSLMTGTGYASANYMLWGNFFIVFSFFFMMIGGCAGSTTCGIKVFRIQVLLSIINRQLQKVLYPHSISLPRYNGKNLSNDVTISVLSFFFVFALCFIGLSFILLFLGLDTLTAFSAAATSLANVGPGLGDIIGPSGSFAPLSDTVKWLLSLAMLLGRLEFFTLLILLSPDFWRR